MSPCFEKQGNQHFKDRDKEKFVLKTAFNRKKYATFQLRTPHKSLLTLLLSLCTTTIFELSPASAIASQLGVVRSRDNTEQWSPITRRLQATGVNYCILEQSSWENASDLNNVSVLFLPNIENLSGGQALALDQWMKRGGKVIVTGPTGTLADPEIRSQLRTLFGAYWGFTINAPSTLKPIQEKQPAWLEEDGLSSTLVGGVIIPTNVNSQKIAVWLSEGKPPAVIATNQSVFLGWRWGVDAVASEKLDTAWLKASLNRYGISRPGILDQFPPQPTSCQSNKPIPTPLVPNNQSNRPVSGTPLTTQLPPLPANSKPVNPPVVTYRGNSNEVQQLTEMEQEFASLIARFESTLLAADAHHTLNVSTEKSLEQLVATKNPSDIPQLTHRSDSLSSNTSAHQALSNAKTGLENFRQLVQQQNYTQARQQWIEARRTLWDNYLLDRSANEPEIRAVWLDRGTIVRAKSEADLASIFDRMAKAGINTVFFETVNAGYPIYPSRVAPEQNPLTKGWDPLKAAVKLAHERKMELHAWVWAFATANQGHNRVLNQPLDYLGPVLSRHPDWGMTDKAGNFFDQGTRYRKAFLDPANPEVQNYLLSLLDEIATTYQVDGIHLDYIRYPFQKPQNNQTFGYSAIARQRFQQMTGVDPINLSPSSSLWSQWVAFRMQQVDTFVATASTRLKQKRPDLILSTAVFPLSRSQRLAQIQQNWEEWGRNGWVDMIVLMTYALDTDNLEEMTQPLFDRSVSSSSLIIPGLRLLNVPDPVTLDQMQFLRNLPTGGYALFAAENFTPNLQSIFTRTQGEITLSKSEPLPYRQPFQSAFERYQSLQKEWRFLLANHRLTMDKATMQEWGKQADRLSEVLKQLANQPSSESLLSARNALTAFRRQFDPWMQQHKTTHPYQVEAWKNRLMTLDQLLNYGERTVLNRASQQVAGQ
jgi:uncharacterized lipoprotein YddW (UPF0748 family)